MRNILMPVQLVQTAICGHIVVHTDSLWLSNVTNALAQTPQQSIHHTPNNAHAKCQTLPETAVHGWLQQHLVCRFCAVFRVLLSYSYARIHMQIFNIEVGTFFFLEGVENTISKILTCREWMRINAGMSSSQLNTVECMATGFRRATLICLR